MAGNIGIPPTDILTVECYRRTLAYENSLAHRMEQLCRQDCGLQQPFVVCVKVVRG